LFIIHNLVFGVFRAFLAKRGSKVAKNYKNEGFFRPKCPGFQKNKIARHLPKPRKNKRSSMKHGTSYTLNIAIE